MTDPILTRKTPVSIGLVIAVLGIMVAIPGWLSYKLDALSDKFPNREVFEKQMGAVVKSIDEMKTELRVNTLTVPRLETRIDLLEDEVSRLRRLHE